MPLSQQELEVIAQQVNDKLQDRDEDFIRRIGDRLEVINEQRIQEAHDFQRQAADILSKKGPSKTLVEKLAKSVNGLQEAFEDPPNMADTGVHFTAFLDKGEGEFENCAEFKGYDDKKKLQVLKVLLKHGAAAWFDRFLSDDMQGEQNSTKILDEFKTKFRERFDKGNAWLEEHLIMFMNQKPGETVQQFYSNLTSRAARLNKTTDELLSMFIRGLANPAKMYVLARQPKNLQEAFALAKTAESLKAITEMTDNELYPLGMPGEIVARRTQTSSDDNEKDQLRADIKQITDMLSKLNLNATKPQRAAVMRCKYCDKPGHRSYECRLRLRDIMGQRPRQALRVPDRQAAQRRRL